MTDNGLIDCHRPPPGEWAQDAACRDSWLTPDAWWPTERNYRHDPLAKAALAICGGCPVRQECLDHALGAREREGIWGGLLPADRERLGRGRRQRTEADHWQAKADAAREVLRQTQETPLRREA